MSKLSNRINIYLRPKRDKDLWDYISSLEEGDVSRELRQLLRDGIKFRNSDITQSHTNSHMALSNQNKDVFNDIKLTKKEITDDELEDKI